MKARHVFVALALFVLPAIMPTLLVNAEDSPTSAPVEKATSATAPAGLPASQADGATVSASAGEPSSQPATQPGKKKRRRPTSEPVSQPFVKAADIKECHALFNKGNYPSAAAGFERFMADNNLRLQAAIGLGRTYQMQGKYTDAVRTLQTVPNGVTDAEWNLLLAELQAAQGNYNDALNSVAKAQERKPNWAPAMFLHGSLLETLGRKDEALAVYNGMDKAMAGDAWRKDARTLTAMGQILDRHAVLTGKKASEQAANILHNYLQEAYQHVDKECWPANIAAGNLLLTKHRPNEAAKEFDLALKINPNLPDALVGIGSLALGAWQFEEALQLADKALKINPNHDQALILKASTYFQWRKLDEIEKCLQRVLATNPNDLEALSLLAALHIRQGQPEKAQPFIDTVKKINPKYFGLPNAIGEWLSAVRQFTDAEKYYRQAIELAPEQAEPLAGLGLMYMQTGDEDKAREILEKAQKIDDYRADVVNYLNSLETLSRFQTRETEHFIIKVDKLDAVMLDPVAQYMERIYPEVTGDYEHKPPVKTIIEIFPTHAGFSVRITGRGWIGTIGACTGRVIVLAAPNKQRSEFGTHNWAAVLRHEFTHAVTLSATENRIPHWFTEACAVWQQPDRRSYDAVNELVNATRRGMLFPVRELDWGFIRPKRAGDRSLAYAQAEWIMECIIDQYGFEKVAAMLRGFRDRKTQKEVFAKILNTTEDDFDKTFREWAKKQVKEWGFDPEPRPELPKAAELAAKNPSNAKLQADLALASYLVGQRDEAEKAARKALQLDANNLRAMGVLAAALQANKKYDDAIAVAQKLESIDHTSRMAPRVLADCQMAQRHLAQAILAFELLKQRQPLDPYSYEQLAKIYRDLGQPQKTLPNLIELHRRTMHEPQYARQIAEIYRTLGSDEEALKYFEQIIYIDPYESNAYESMAAIHLRAKQYQRAISDVNNVCLLAPESANSWALLAIIRYRTGKATNDKQQYSLAKTAASKALELDSGNAKAQQVLAAIEAAMKE